MTLTLTSPLFFILVLLAIAIYFFIEWRRKETGYEAEFLEELVERHNHWKDKGQTEYAEAYKVLINKFTQITDEQ